MNFDGSNCLDLSQYADDNPFLSPDGKCVGWINYAPSAHVVIADAVGKGAINLSGVNDLYFDWTFGSVPASPAASPTVQNSSASAS